MKKLVLISLLAMGSGVAGCCGDGSGDHAEHSNALNTAGAASTTSGDRVAASNASGAAGGAARAGHASALSTAGAGAAATGGGAAHAGHAIALSTAGTIASENEGKWIWNGQGHKELQTLRSKNGFAVLSFTLPKSTEFPNFEIFLIKSGVNEYTISTTDKDSYGKLASLTLKVAAPTDELQKRLPQLQELHVEQKKEREEIKKILKSSIEYVWIDEEGQEHKSGDKEVTEKRLNKPALGDEFLSHYQVGDKPHWIVTRKVGSVGKYGWKIAEQLEHSDAHDVGVVEEVDTKQESTMSYQITHEVTPNVSRSLSTSSWTDAEAPLDQHHTDDALSSEHNQTRTSSVKMSERDGKTIKTTTTHTTYTTTTSSGKQMVVAEGQPEAHASIIASDANSEQSGVIAEPQSPSQKRLTGQKNKQNNKNKK